MRNQVPLTIIYHLLLFSMTCYACAFQGSDQSLEIAQSNETASEQTDASALASIRQSAHKLSGAANDYDPLMKMIGDARFVLLGEATHGTHEFYRERALITRRLIEEKGFDAVVLEADWTDAFRANEFVQGASKDQNAEQSLAGFTRFPQWMWRNTDVEAFTSWLKRHNEGRPQDEMAGFYGLDLYSMAASMEAVLAHVGRGDDPLAADVRRNYACLQPYADEPADYAADVLRPRFDTCEDEVAAVLKALRERGAPGREDAHFDAVQNARVVAGSERYFRSQAQGTESSWNLRDRHMFETLLALLEVRGPDAKAVVWAHNSHVGHAAATEMGERGETNIGELARKHFGDAARLVGFGTDRGTVMAASRWDGPPEVRTVRPSLPESYGALFREVGPERFLLDLRQPALRQALRPMRPQRAIGVLYLPETERMSHYFDAALPDQFDAFVFLEETRAVTPVTAAQGLPHDHPFA